MKNIEAKTRVLEDATRFRARYVADEINTIAATIHQLGGRQKYLPAQIPAENISPAQPSGCRADIWLSDLAATVGTTGRLTCA